MVVVLILFCVLVLVGMMSVMKLSSMWSREEEKRWEDG